MVPRLHRQILRLGLIEKVLLSLLALNALVWLLERVLRWKVPDWGLLQIATYIAGFLLLVKLLRMWARALLWRVRNRMIVLFLFVGLVPLLLVAALAGLAGYFLTGQAAVYMAASELDRRGGRLQGAAAALLWSLHAAEPSRRGGLIYTYLARATESWPGLQGLIRDSGRIIIFPAGANLDPPHTGIQNFQGIVRRENKFYLLAHVSGLTTARAARTAPPESVAARRPGPSTPAPSGAETPGKLEVILLQPLGEPLLAALAPGLARISFLPLRQAGATPETPSVRLKIGDMTLVPDIAVPATDVTSHAPLPAPANRFDYAVTWATSPFQVERWRENDADAYGMLTIHTRPAAVFRRLFGQQVEVAYFVTVVAIIIGTLFLVVELLSLVVGVSITRTLTNSVHQLYQGTRRVNAGDFSQRIQISGRDQLAELSRSFNSMTESIERLIEESKERQRMASELEIAREVQEQLFPKAPPEMRRLEILGVCNAARMVSGDYFDFVKLSKDRLALAIGDVAGKGIQGALLMASIQSMLRTQLSATAAGQEAQTDDAVWRFPTAVLVSQLNQQLYESTAPEKFATFFFGAYDDRSGVLTYTNAGHPPPVLIRNGDPRRLDVNGMVVGAFPFASYEQSEIELCTGDLIVAFTDGVTEPENEFGEEFGESRLIELLVRNWRRPPREIIDEALGAVSQWTGRPELQDDMTMLVARRL